MENLRTVTQDIVTKTSSPFLSLPLPSSPFLSLPLSLSNFPRYLIAGLMLNSLKLDNDELPSCFEATVCMSGIMFMVNR